MEQNNQDAGIARNPQTQAADQQPKQKKSKIGWGLCAAGILPLAAAVLVIVLTLAFIGYAYVAPTDTDALGIGIYSIQTDSMCDTLMPGDLIIGTKVKDTSTLRIGDIITYWTVINGERVLNTSRIHGIYDAGGFLIFETMGDANTAVDPLTVHESDVVSKYAFRIGGLGMVFDYLQTSTGIALFVLCMAVLCFLLLILGIALIVIGLVFVIKNRRKNRKASDHRT